MVETAAPAVRGQAIAKRPRMRTMIPKTVISSTPFLDGSRREGAAVAVKTHSGWDNGALVRAASLQNRGAVSTSAEELLGRVSGRARGWRDSRG